MSVKKEDIQQILSTTLQNFNKVDILFNGAGIFDMRHLLDESWDVFDQLFTVNVKKSFFLMQAVAKQMIEQNEDGKIINKSSQAGRRGRSPCFPLLCNPSRHYKLYSISLHDFGKI